MIVSEPSCRTRCSVGWTGRIIRDMLGATRVTYHIASKPPGTIE